MRQLFSLSTLTLLSLSLSTTNAGRHPHFSLSNFKTLVTFGDSYTDDSRLGYFINNDGEAPPVGWVQPENSNSASGGYTWGHFVAQSTKVNRYNYAVSGAVCSNEITPRAFTAINDNFPSVLEYEVPAFVADSQYKTKGKKFLDIPSDGTVYAIWIGTNDLGNNAFLTDSQLPGKTIPDYAECVYQVLDQVYAKAKGRYFVIMNNAPLQLAPMYATPENDGTGPSQYWPDKPENDTMISYRMWEQVATVNEVFEYKTPFEAVVARRYPGAKFAVMDMYGFLSDMYHNPKEYFGDAANVTGYINHCDLNGQACTRLEDEGSYLWYDELHPSEKADEIIAEEFVQVVDGKSKWATYW